MNITLLDMKMIGASITAAAASVGSDVVNSGWESMTLKGALIAAIWYLYRELSTQRDLNKAEATKREDILIETLKTYQDAAQNQVKAIDELRSATETQTGWFKTVAQTLLNRNIEPKLPQ